jgi:hypothetical protein
MAVTGSWSLAALLRDLSSSDVEASDIKAELALSGLFADGTGAGQVTKFWQDIRPLTDGGNESLDFSPTPASGKQGAVTFTALKFLLIWSPSTNTTNLTISRPAANGIALFGAASGSLAPIKPGLLFLYIDNSAGGLVVTAGTGDLITITNSAGAAATYGVIAAGI